MSILLSEGDAVNWIELLVTAIAMGGINAVVPLDGCSIVDVEPFSCGAIAVLSTADGISLLLIDSLGNQTLVGTDIEGGSWLSCNIPDILCFNRYDLGTGLVQVARLQHSENLWRTSWLWTHEQALTDSDGQWFYVTHANDNGYIVTAGDSWSLAENNWIAKLDENGNQDWLVEGIEGFQGELLFWGDRIALDCGSAVRILNDVGQQVRIDSFPSMAVRSLSSVGDDLLVALQDTSGMLIFAYLDNITNEFDLIDTGDQIASFAYWTDRPELYCVPNGAGTFMVADNPVDRNIPYLVYRIADNAVINRFIPDTHFDFDVKRCFPLSEGLCVLGLSQSRDLPDIAAVDLLDIEGRLDSSIQLNGMEILDAQHSGTAVLIGTTTNGIYVWFYRIDDQGIAADYRMSLAQSGSEIRSLYLSAYPLFVGILSPTGQARWSTEGSALITGMVP